MKENSQSILLWGDATFGPVTKPVKLAQRAKAELEELIEAIYLDDLDEIGKEAADVAILLHRLLGHLDKDLSEEVDLKMAINRNRQWKSVGDGTGSHSVKSPNELPE